MGIKGIFAEIGQGQRIALAKLAIDVIEKTGRPLRIAVDVSIWLFQIQSGKGGANPALRTLYYRLLRLVSLCIQPIFVFDGSQKPPFKRNKRTGSNNTSLTEFNAKQLLKLFGFAFHIAPGEAEAECALLQREGVVDAVLSEDVDTLMFGCRKTLRKWSSEESHGNHSPTHVTVYDAEVTKVGKSGLDREGMILVALMSGGDYITEGIPGCGIKVACEAARAGYGKSLCMLARTDKEGFEKWRENLNHELQTNESKHFRTKHMALKVPNTFPDKEVLGYYTHPVVSSCAKVDRLRSSIQWGSAINVVGLRLFAAEALDWTGRIGAKKFIRGLAPAMLVSKLAARANRRPSLFDDPVLTAKDEMELVIEICGKRSHFSTDATPELRLVYCPHKIVGIDIDDVIDDRDESGRDGLAPLGEDENIRLYESEDEEQENSRSKPTSPTKRGLSAYNPTQPDKTWVPQTIAKLGIPLKVEDYEKSQRMPQKSTKSKVASKRNATKDGMPIGALDRYFPVTKTVLKCQKASSPTKLPTVRPSLPPAFLTPAIESMSPSRQFNAPHNQLRQEQQARKSVPEPPGRLTFTPKKSTSREGVQKKPIGRGNPWTSSQSPSSRANGISRIVAPISKAIYAKEKGVKSGNLRKPPKQGLNVPSAGAESPPSSPHIFRKHLLADTPPPVASLHPSSLKEFQSPSPSKEHSPQTLRCPGSSGALSRNSCHHPAILDHDHSIESHISPSCDVNSDLPRMKSSISVAQQSHDALAIFESGRNIITISSSPIITSPQASLLKTRAHHVPTEDLGSPLPKKSGERAVRNRFLMLRQSLEGSWKEGTEEERQSIVGRGRNRAWRLSEVEVVDLVGVPSH